MLIHNKTSTHSNSYLLKLKLEILKKTALSEQHSVCAPWPKESLKSPPHWGSLSQHPLTRWLPLLLSQPPTPPSSRGKGSTPILPKPCLPCFLTPSSGTNLISLTASSPPTLPSVALTVLLPRYRKPLKYRIGRGSVLPWPDVPSNAMQTWVPGALSNQRWGQEPAT